MYRLGLKYLPENFAYFKQWNIKDDLCEENRIRNKKWVEILINSSLLRNTS